MGVVLRPEVSAALGPLGLTLPEFVCLRILSQSPGSSNAELARRAGVSPQAMNTVLRRLEEIGAVGGPRRCPLVARCGDTHPDGRNLLKRAEAVVRGADARFLARLSESEQRDFKRMLELLGSD